MTTLIRQQSYAALLEEAEAIWTDEAVAEASKGIPPAMWPYKRSDFIQTHIAFHRGKR